MKNNRNTIAIIENQKSEMIFCDSLRCGNFKEFNLRKEDEKDILIELDYIISKRKTDYKNDELKLIIRGYELLTNYELSNTIRRILSLNGFNINVILITKSSNVSVLNKTLVSLIDNIIIGKRTNDSLNLTQLTFIRDNTKILNEISNLKIGEYIKYDSIEYKKYSKINISHKTRTKTFSFE